MFIDICTDNFFKIHNSNTLEEIIENTIFIEPLINYFNESISKVGKRYKSVFPFITSNLRFLKNSEKYET